MRDETKLKKLLMERTDERDAARRDAAVARTELKRQQEHYERNEALRTVIPVRFAIPVRGREPLELSGMRSRSIHIDRLGNVVLAGLWQAPTIWLMVRGLWALVGRRVTDAIMKPFRPRPRPRIVE